jgi:hypothetical protein
MKTRTSACVVFLGIVCMTAVSAAPQQSSRNPQPADSRPSAAAQKASASAGAEGQRKPYTVPRNAYGQPDLEGVWTNNNATPLQRPAAWAGKAVLSEAEFQQVRNAAQKLEQRGDALFGDELINDTLQGKAESESHDTETGNYNGFWLPGRDFDNRTSLIIDPADGRIPPETQESQQRRAAAAEQRRLHPADGPENRGLSERCITFGVPRFQAAYSSVYRIVQSPDAVVFLMETIHDARVIPLDGRSHLSDKIAQWHGNSVGHWEGDTLVVDTTGFSPKSNFMGASKGLHLVERFTRVGKDVLQYDATMSDSATWTRPWTVRIPFKATDEPLLEYACHEGNAGMFGILGGARKQEAEQAAAR